MTGLTLADELLFTSINLNRVCQNSPAGSGTGFFWTTPLENGREFTTLITNRHVIEGADHIVAMCHRADASRQQSSGKFANCVLPLERVIPHPDPSIDLCAIPFGSLINDAVAAKEPLFFKTLKAVNVPTEADWENFDSIEDVLMVGCPRGIFDQFNNLPIARRGITATPLGKRYEGRPEFMVDMACFPGSSGSPVFMVSNLGFFDRKEQQWKLEGRFFFLGVLYCGPVINQEGQIVLNKQARFEVAAMMHLGQVIRSTALLDFDKFIQERIAAEAAAGIAMPS
jgi:hypothetical protein